MVFVAEDDLGIDGAKTLYATATEIGLDESDPSIEYAFTLDVVAPEIVSITAEAEGLDVDDEATLTVTFSEEIDAGTIDKISGCCLWDITSEASPGDPFVAPLGDVFDLVSPKVLEMKGELIDLEDSLALTEYDLIRVGYDFSDPASLVGLEWLVDAEELTEDEIEDFEMIYIADLAGNELLDSVHYCYLELED